MPNVNNVHLMKFLSFQENATIVKLDLSGNHLGEAGAKHMSDVLNNNTIISDLVSTVCLSVISDLVNAKLMSDVLNTCQMF